MTRLFLFILLLLASASAEARLIATRGPVTLAAREGGLFGEIVLTNDGDTTVQVSRVAVRGDTDDVRSPPRVSVRFEAGGTSAALPPGQSRKVIVSYLPEKDPRVRQAFGHVVVTSTDEASGEIVVGFQGQLSRAIPFVSEHILTWLVALPLLGGLLSLALRRATLVVAGLQLLFAVWALVLFVPEVTRADGNDGFQLVERAVWIRSLGVEYFVGVDGASLPLIVLAAILALVGGKPQHLFLCGLATGALVALDLLLFSAMLLAAVALASAAHPRRVVWLAIGGLLVVLSVQLLAGRAVLADGTSVARGFALPEMARVAHAAGTVKLAFVLLFAGAMILAGIFPLHPWLPQTEDASIVALVPKLGAYALVRVGFMVMPEGVRWAAGAVVAFGAITVVYAALCARAEKRLVRFAAYATMAQMGLVFVGLGSLTPQGIGGAMFACFAHGLATPLLLASARMLESRARTSEIARFGGLSRETPVLAVVLAVALLSSMGAPATAGLWGSLLPVLGAFPIHRVLAGVAALGIVLVAAAHAHALRTMLFGSLDARWRSSEELEPFGGRLPDAGARDLVLVAPLVVLVVVLGVWPAPLFGVLSGAVSDIASAVNPPGPSQIALLFP